MGSKFKFLGIRETGIYGMIIMIPYVVTFRKKFRDKNIKIEIFQSNYER